MDAIETVRVECGRRDEIRFGVWEDREKMAGGSLAKPN